MKLPYPLCLRCGRRVESMTVKHLDRSHLLIVVDCHGERDTCRLPVRALRAATAIHPGVAFGERKAS